jgi:hypothetical protein
MSNFGNLKRKLFSYSEDWLVPEYILITIFIIAIFIFDMYSLYHLQASTMPFGSP